MLKVKGDTIHIMTEGEEAWGWIMLVPWFYDPIHNSSYDAGKGLFNAPADLLSQILADDDDINKQVSNSMRRKRHPQNNNKTSDLYKAMLMMRTRRDACLAVHNALFANE